MCRSLHCGTQVQLLLGSDIKALLHNHKQYKAKPTGFIPALCSVCLLHVKGQGATSTAPKAHRAGEFLWDSTNVWAQGKFIALGSEQEATLSLISTPRLTGNNFNCKEKHTAPKIMRDSPIKTPLVVGEEMEKSLHMLPVRAIITTG